MKQDNRKFKVFARGFSLIEIMAVIIILGLLGAIVAVNIGGRIGKARITTTKASLKQLHDAVVSFYMDQGRYPSEDIGLLELIEPSDDTSGYWPPGGYLETTEVPKDAWNNDFYYERYPDSGKPFVIISFGADGEQGGESDDTDLHSTDAY